MFEVSATVNGVASTRQFLYDGDALVAEYSNSGNLLNRYVHGSSVDKPFLWYSGSSVNATIRRNLYADYQGSVVAVTDSGATVQGVNAYDAYGIPHGNNLGRFSYTGQIYLPEMGLQYYKARIYSPALGRFLQTDPIGYKDQMNLYAYVGNDPVNKSDPSGLAKCAKSMGDKCEGALNDADKARDTARADAKNMNALAGRVKEGTTTAEDKDALKGLGEKGYNTSAGGLTNIANKLNGAANKIGERGSGMTLRNGGDSSTDYAEAPKINFGLFTIHRGATLYDKYFSTQDASRREQVMLHEAMHNIGIYGDEYDKAGVDGLIGSEKAFLGNADTYTCIPYSTACGY